MMGSAGVMRVVGSACRLVLRAPCLDQCVPGQVLSASKPLTCSVTGRGWCSALQRAASAAHHGRQ
eukprot:15480826-Alexandrium_andersonii.AAC.1